MLEKALQSFNELGNRPTEGRFTAILAEAYLLMGDLDRAKKPADGAIAVNQGLGSLFNLAVIQRTLGRVARGGGALAEARLQEAFETFVAIGAKYGVARTRLDLAEVARARGDSGATASLISEALRAFEALNIPAWVTRATALAERLGVRVSDSSTG